ncbi:MAG: DUF2807 domain-containing protein [Bacteroidales bacterium]|nr:DUF2807 domain-containing protein [Bacteroidales bacterium]
MRKNKIIRILLSLAFLILCQNIVKAQEVTERRDLAKFESVNLKGIGNVYVKMGEKQSVQVVADSELLPKIITEVNGNELSIRLKKGFGEFISEPKIDVFIVMEQIKGFKLSGVGKIESEGILETDDIEIKNSGVGSIILQLKSGDIITKLSGVGKVDLAGEAITNNIEISGAGKVVANDLITKNVTVKSSGVGNCTVNATDNLDVKVSGIGKVKYYGNPQVNSNVSGLGSIESLE